MQILYLDYNFVAVFIIIFLRMICGTCFSLEFLLDKGSIESYDIFVGSAKPFNNVLNFFLIPPQKMELIDIDKYNSEVSFDKLWPHEIS